jgi:hypothetical protein
VSLLFLSLGHLLFMLAVGAALPASLSCASQQCVHQWHLGLKLFLLPD